MVVAGVLRGDLLGQIMVLPADLVVVIVLVEVEIIHHLEGQETHQHHIHLHKEMQVEDLLELADQLTAVAAAVALGPLVVMDHLVLVAQVEQDLQFL
jgi:hypothetical protein